MANMAWLPARMTRDEEDFGGEIKAFGLQLPGE